MLYKLQLAGLELLAHWDSNLRWSINGTYMKKFLMDKHQWTEKTWKMIDREFIKMTMKFPVSPSAKSQWFKLMHDLQPLGRRKKKMLDTGVSFTSVYY